MTSRTPRAETGGVSNRGGKESHRGGNQSHRGNESHRGNKSHRTGKDVQTPRTRILARAYTYIGLDRSNTASSAEKPSILMLGDLLVPRGEREEGIGQYLTKHMHREGDHYKVINLAQRGYNSQWLRHDVRRVLASALIIEASIACVIVMVGSHDAGEANPPPYLLPLTCPTADQNLPG